MDLLILAEPTILTLDSNDINFDNLLIFYHYILFGSYIYYR